MSKPNQDMYWCQFCKKFIQNKPVTRQQHESSFSHKKNMQKYLENEKREESKKQQQELNTLQLIKNMEEQAIKQIQSDISHGAIRENDISKDDGLRDDLNEIKKKRRDAQEQEKSARSYVFEYVDGKLKNPIKSIPKKESTSVQQDEHLSKEGTIGNWYFSENKEELNTDDWIFE